MMARRGGGCATAPPPPGPSPDGWRGLAARSGGAALGDLVLLAVPILEPLLPVAVHPPARPALTVVVAVPMTAPHRSAEREEAEEEERDEQEEREEREEAVAAHVVHDLDVAVLLE